MGAEAPEPELDMVFCCGEPRKDWAVKACRACCRSSSVCEETEGGDTTQRSVHVFHKYLRLMLVLPSG